MSSGTGKTTICKALAQKVYIRNCERYSSGVLLEVNSHSLFSKWFSESGKNFLFFSSHFTRSYSLHASIGMICHSGRAVPRVFCISHNYSYLRVFCISYNYSYFRVGKLVMKLFDHIHEIAEVGGTVDRRPLSTIPVRSKIIIRAKSLLGQNRYFLLYSILFIIIFNIILKIIFKIIFNIIFNIIIKSSGRGLLRGRAD